MLKPLLLTLLFTLPTLTFAQGTLTERGVLVTGTGTVYGEPDQASFEVGVSALEQDVTTATDEVNERVTRVMAALQDAGVAARDIRTLSFAIYPEQTYRPNGQPGVLRYRVLNLLHVTVRDPAQLGALLGRSVEAGANEVMNVQYTFSDPDGLERRARQQAMEDAREKAEQLASLARVELGAVRRIVEGTQGGGVVPFAEERIEALSTSTDVPVSSGQLAVTVTLQVTFGLEQQ